jgi:hypothetical protein
MKFPALILLTCCVPLACGRSGSQHTVRVTSASDLERLVGRRVELVGIVSSDRVPQLQGVDLWGMEHLRGKPARVSGVLQRTEFFQTKSDVGRAADSGTDNFFPPVYRGAGTYYRLQDLRME